MSKTSETSFGSRSSDLKAPAAALDVPADAIRLVLAGHHPLTLCGLSQVLQSQSDCVVLAVCSDPSAVMDIVQRHQPDVLILDLERNPTFKILRRIQHARLSTRVIVLATASEEDEMGAATRVGAAAVLMKELPADVFVGRIREVSRGERPPRDDNDGGLMSKLRGGRLFRGAIRQLTPREAEIARLAILGISTRDIAERLDVKQGTVKIHLHSIYEKLNVGGRLGLILFARRHGLA